jgi:hypothetical protein
MAQLKHKGCNGVMAVDIADQFVLRTHSIRVTPVDVQLGVLELNIKPGRRNKPKLVCNKCERKYDMDGDLDGVVTMCLVCTKSKPVQDVFVAYQFPCICSSCIKDLTEENDGKKSKDREGLAQYLNVSMSDIKFVSYIEVLKKPIE